MSSPTPAAPPASRSQALSLFFGGLLPILAFTFIEDHYGPLWGTVAGMVFGLGELIYEKVRLKKISTITWIGNGMILALGGISIVSQDGIWFKLQPALLEAFFTVFLWVGLATKRNFLLMMAEKQGQKIPDMVKPFFNGMTFRLGLFFALHAILAVWAALDWSTESWALLKGVGLTVSMVVYLVLEMIVMRWRLARQH